MTQPLNEQLKPCPFCGGEAKTHGPYGWDRLWCISHNCKTFYNGGSEAFKDYPSEAYAITAWNTRINEQPSALADETTGWHFRAGAVDIEDGDQHWHADIDTLHHGGVVQCWGTRESAVALRDRILTALKTPDPQVAVEEAPADEPSDGEIYSRLSFNSDEERRAFIARTALNETRHD